MSRLTFGSFASASAYSSLDMSLWGKYDRQDYKASLLIRNGEDEGPLHEERVSVALRESRRLGRRPEQGMGVRTALHPISPPSKRGTSSAKRLSLAFALDLALNASIQDRLDCRMACQLLEPAASRSWNRVAAGRCTCRALRLPSTECRWVGFPNTSLTRTFRTPSEIVSATEALRSRCIGMIPRRRFYPRSAKKAEFRLCANRDSRLPAQALGLIQRQCVLGALHAARRLDNSQSCTAP